METKQDENDRMSVRTLMFYALICGLIFGDKFGEYYATKKQEKIQFERGFMDGREYQLKVMEQRLLDSKL